jgi:hypothetical protein
MLKSSLSLCSELRQNQKMKIYKKVQMLTPSCIPDTIT